MLNTTAWNRFRYSAYAPLYDVMVARALRRPRRIALGQIDWEPGMRVLLVGAGTGLDLPFLPRELEIHLTDLTPAMLKRANARAERYQRDVNCQVMDASALAFTDEHFDVVIMHLILAVMPYPERGLSEAYRVLKPGGQLCVLDKFQPDHQQTGSVRRAANIVTSLIATDITRQATPLLQQAGFYIRHDEPVLMNGLFRALIAGK
ncbi:class I SAM-dependent methyltransferase [Halomonas sp. DWK9]|uniref:class I SAM-dependent methyltransferase n=1 Tax=Halomonas sp. DWK9 TaxID=3060155 RepID=UPI00287F7037|nr:class I SAM-dependent methyltransferase [Halomonas sp. DWK9]